MLAWLSQRFSSAHLIALLALIVAMGGFATARIPGPDGRIHACFQKRGKAKGDVRIVDSRKRCTRRERRITWNRRGVPGVPGQQGPPGSDAQFTGAPAGGDLTGSYPNPLLAPGSVTPDKLGVAPGAKMYRSATQAFPHNFLTPINFDSVAYDTGTIANTTTDGLTVPRPGRYLLIGGISWPLNSTGSRSLEIRVDLLFVARDIRPAVSGNTTYQTTSTVRRLTGGEKITLTAAQQSGVELDVAGGEGSTFLALEWLGP